MITRDQLIAEIRAKWRDAILGVFGFCMFLLLGVFFVGQELKQDAWSSALGALVLCPAGMTCGIVVAVYSSRKARDKEKFFFQEGK